jgi:formylglycine-generating enzyme required for sulfatase activity/serine/threonine protein kinase
MGEHLSDTDLPLEELRRVDALCERFEAALRDGRAIDPAALLEEVSRGARATLLRELLALELEYAAPAENERVLAAWSQRFPEYFETARATTAGKAAFSAEIDDRTTAYGPVMEPDTQAPCASSSQSGELRPDAGTAPGPAGVAIHFGEYEVLEEVDGTPGGAIYRARQPSLNRLVALTVLAPECLPTPAARRRFRRDAESAGRLDHPGVVRILEVAEDAGRHLVSAAWVEGESLAKRLETGPLRDAEAANLIHQLAEAVYHAHALGVVDGALTPARVLIGSDGRARLRGFGLSSRAVPFLRMMPAGSIGFLAPERARTLDLQEFVGTEPAADTGFSGSGETDASQNAAPGQVDYGSETPAPAGDRAENTKQNGPSDVETPAELLNPDFELSGIEESKGSLGGAGGTRINESAGLGWSETADSSSRRRHRQECPLPQSESGDTSDDEEPTYNLVQIERIATEPTVTPPLGRGEDVYGLGAILYAALTARPPFQAATRVETLRQVSDDAPLDPSRLNPRINRDLEAVCLKCLEKDSRRRYQSVAELLGDVLAWQARRPVKARPGGALRQAKLWCQRNQQTVALAVIGLVVGFGPEVWDWWRADPSNQAGAPAVSPAPTGLRPTPAAGRTMERPDNMPSPGAPLPAWPVDEVANTPPPERAQKSLILDLGDGIKMEFARIPAGEFMMGKPDSEPRARPDGTSIGDFRVAEEQKEKPHHRVRISSDFEMAIYPVTQEQYEKVMGSNPSHFSAAGAGKSKVERMDTRQYPVEMVSWYESNEFCRKLSELTGRPCVLPTEAQWEYACRAGTLTSFHFGTSCDGTQANCDGNIPYGTREKGPFLGRTCPVGSYPPNPFGLYDMHGNVLQWCRDYCDAGPYNVSITVDPPGPASGGMRVQRGGGWNHDAWGCRAAYRAGNNPAHRYYHCGLRVVCPLAAPEP